MCHSCSVISGFLLYSSRCFIRFFSEFTCCFTLPYPPRFCGFSPHLDYCYHFGMFSSRVFFPVCRRRSDEHSTPSNPRRSHGESCLQAKPCHRTRSHFQEDPLLDPYDSGHFFPPFFLSLLPTPCFAATSGVLVQLHGYTHNK